MRHLNKINRLGRNATQRKALLKSMAIALIEHERISTTLVRAKELRPFVEKMITLGKRGDLTARRTAAKHIPDKQTVKKLFDVLAPRFTERNGGYTRIYKTGRRAGDNAQTSIIEILR